MPFPGHRNARLPLLAEISYQAGPEGTVHIVTRGWTFVFPGGVCILDVVHALNGQRNEI